MIDTSIAIHLRDDTAAVRDRIAELDAHLYLSVVSRVELEGGIQIDPSWRVERRQRLDILLATLEVVDFTQPMATVYGAIVAQLGFNRRKIIDRMIAATAIVTGLTLITMNGSDFAEIEGLTLDVWRV